MLSQDRQFIFDEIIRRMDSDLNNVHDFNNNPVDNQSFWAQQWTNDGNFSVPPEAVGWPTGLIEYVRRISLMMAYEILNSVYTEQELEQKAEDIILDNDEKNGQ